MEALAEEFEPAEPLLEIEGISKEFAGLAALEDVSFEVPRDRIVGLVGPNGAGKTTLLDIISGITPRSRGSVRFAGTDVSGWAPQRIARLGMVRTYQSLQLFPDMTALENVMVGCDRRQRAGFVQTMMPTPGAVRDERQAREEAHEQLALLGLTDLADVVASDLSYGQQRRVEIARALATRPQLLLMDEPTAGVTSSEIGRFLDLVRALRSGGRSVLLIEHNMRVVREICDEVTVLHFGRVIARGTPAEALDDPRVIDVYLGRGNA